MNYHILDAKINSSEKHNLQEMKGVISTKKDQQSRLLEFNT